MTRPRLATVAALPVLALAASFALSGWPAAADDENGLTASVRLEPSSAGFEELVTFSITVEASGFSGLSITPSFELENLEAVAGPFQSRSQRWVNGETSNSVQLTWRLRPKAIGPARVAAIRILAGDKTIELGERSIEILKETPPERARPAAQAQRPGADPFEDFFNRAFPDARRDRRATARMPKISLKSEITPAEVFVGQQATYTLWLYTQSDINAFQPTKVPDFKGFWVREIPQPPELKPEWVDLGGERYGRVPMLRRAIFPLKSGRFSIDPTEVDVVARIADIGPFGSPFGRQESFHLKTDPSVIVAKPLPPGAAGGSFAGPVGEVTLSARLDRGALDVGQAATLTVRCTGRGNLQSLAPPALDLPEGVRGFPPRQDSTERLTDGLLVSSAEWSYVLVPERPGRFDVGGIRIPYFDPAKGEYRVAETAPPVLVVTGTALAAPPLAAPPTPSPAAAADTATAGASRLHLDSSTLRTAAIAGGGAALALGLFFGIRRRNAGGRGASSRTLRAAIASASAAATPRQAAAELEEAWRQHLAERFQIPPGTPVSNWSDRLVAGRADEGAARRLAELAHELHYLRYAPELSAADRLLADALATSHRLARALR